MFDQWNKNQQTVSTQGVDPWPHCWNLNLVLLAPGLLIIFSISWLVTIILSIFKHVLCSELEVPLLMPPGNNPLCPRLDFWESHRHMSDGKVMSHAHEPAHLQEHKPVQTQLVVRIRCLLQLCLPQIRSDPSAGSLDPHWTQWGSNLKRGQSGLLQFAKQCMSFKNIYEVPTLFVMFQRLEGVSV